jgi:hypothetical protein
MNRLILFIFTLTALTSVAEAKKTYLVKGVASIGQTHINKKIQKKNKEVLEGCGPVAAAMVLGYWQTERGEKSLLTKSYTGEKHPTRSIEILYETLKTKSVPGKNNDAAFTFPGDFYRGLRERAAGHKLEVKRMLHVNGFDKKEKEIKKQLRAGNPVVILKFREHKDGCIGEGNRGYNIYKNVENSHYYVIVGYKGNKFAVMPGFSDSPKSESQSWSDYANTTKSNARRICTSQQLKRDGISLFWIERSKSAWCSSDSHCPKKQWCNKGFIGIGKNKCQAKLKLGKKCSRDRHCSSGECKGFKCKKMKDQCKKDKDCGKGKWCDKGTVGVGKNICKSKLKKGAKCVRKGQCKSKTCRLFKCK